MVLYKPMKYVINFVQNRGL